MNTATGPATLIAIKASQVSSNLVGTPQLAAVQAQVRWNAYLKTGELCR